ncbi:hypothetical protein B0H14DRAFT_3483650 [Mycena olivaceomarginata]|nr:hypothetical protein B0H14DRAFT_3483650 [Mycena olivaceomarginata]
MPIKCPLDCDQFHWKYNFQQHLILSQYFLSTIHISSAEQEALGIPCDDVIGAAPPNPLKVLLRVVAGSGPHRALRIHPARANKENDGIPAIDSRAVTTCPRPPGKARQESDLSIVPFPESTSAMVARTFRDKSRITCYRCGKLGHYRNECPLIATDAAEGAAAAPTTAAYFNAYAF